MKAERMQVVVQEETTSSLEGEKLLSPQQVEGRLHKIWYNFEMSPRRPEDAGRRRNELRELSDSLSPVVERYLEEEIDVVRAGARQRIPRGLWIKAQAMEEARVKLREKKADVLAAKEKAAKASRSEK